MRLRSWEFQSEQGVPLRLFVMAPAKGKAASSVVLSVVDERSWKDFARQVGPRFAKLLGTSADIQRDDAMFTQNLRAMESQNLAFAVVAPRGVGPTRWIPDTPPKTKGPDIDTLHRRRFALIGQTLDGQRVWDVRRAIQALAKVNEWKDAILQLHGHREMAVVAAYAAIHEPGVKRLDLWHPPTTHRNGAVMLNVLRYFDIPQALAMAFPTEVRLYVAPNSDRSAWQWPIDLQNGLGLSCFKIREMDE
jgi:hypothetical protein